jgi:hypothetical protein
MNMNQVRRFSVLFCLLAALLFATGTGRSAVAQTQGNATETAPASIQPPEHPITREQLQQFFTSLNYFESQRSFLHNGLEAKFKTMPAWFPRSVWQDAENHIEAIDLVTVALPIYQKYISQEQADALILLLDGPTGQEIARLMTGRALQALQTGARGSAADEIAIKASNAGGDSEIFAKRIRELDPNQRDKMLPAFQRLQLVWKQIDDEQDKAFNLKANEVLQAVLKQHNSELLSAQRTAGQTHSTPAPLAH